MSQRHTFSADARAGQAHLRIMSTTDLHMQIYPYDYYGDQTAHSVGLARTAAHIVAGRKEATNSVLVDNGDFLQGNPMGDFAASDRQNGRTRPHPMIAAMNALRYDAGTVGNHEFNFGLDYLKWVVSGATFPMVSANLIETRGAPHFRIRRSSPRMLSLIATLPMARGHPTKSRSAFSACSRRKS